uniref:WD repeat and FYVE domain containing 2 n=1 Tax=Scleropages formosus TaxID=113540 RepID=A0A8C9VGZ4_SCLFO
MAAEVHPKPQARKPVLLSKIEASQDVVNTAVIIPKEDGVISVSEDRTVRIWLKRDSGQYWPSVYHTMPAPCSCMYFNPETRRLSVGMDNGTVSDFILSEDYNKMTPAATYQAHQGRVTVVLFVLEMEWVLSTGQDKTFTWHCSESGQRLGSYRTTAWVSGLQYPTRGGSLRHTNNNNECGQTSKLVQTHLPSTPKHPCANPCVRDYYTGVGCSYKGVMAEKVQGLCYAPHTRQLISCSSDGGIVIWNMDVRRQETPEWLDSDSCQKCEQPFFWNFKQMWDSKKIGLRQHHCRKCGQAVCGKCSSRRSTIPLMGFEFEVRVCDSCYESITDEDRAPTATFHDSKHGIVYMHYEPTRGWLLTSGVDKVIKLWDMTPVVS